MCHLHPCAVNLMKTNTSKVLKFYTEELAHAVDFFHFKGHVDDRCRKDYNPHTVQAELKFEKLNTPVCEQLFNLIQP